MSLDLSNDIFCQQIDNDLSISRNVSSNKMIHAILALVFLTKLFLSSHFSAPNYEHIYSTKTLITLFIKWQTYHLSFARLNIINCIEN